MNTIESNHRETWDLIPWIVNQSASAEDCGRAMIHLQACADCKEEFALQSRIHAGMNEQGQSDHEDASFALRALIQSIDANDALSASTANGYGQVRTALQNGPAEGEGTRGSRRLLTGLAAAVVLQAIGLIALGSSVLESRNMNGRSEGYTTFSANESSGTHATIRLVPSPTQDVGSLQRLLEAAGLQVVGSNRGATILALAPVATTTRGPDPDRSTHEIIELLRNSPDILLVEPILSAATGQ